MPPGEGKIVSTNPCLDAILVELIPPERIGALSHYSGDPRSSSIDPALARRFPATNGTAEEVLALRPELVLASSFTPAATQAAYRRLGLEVATFGTASTIEDNKRQILDIAAAVGAPERGRAIVARIDRAVAAVSPRDAARPSALLWLGSSALVNGGGTLIDDLLRTAGFRNASADYGIRYTAALPLELVAANPPDVMLSPAPSPGSDPQARRLLLRHQAMRAAGKRVVEGQFPENMIWCGGPTILRALPRLAAIRREAVK